MFRQMGQHLRALLNAPPPNPAPAAAQPPARRKARRRKNRSHRRGGLRLTTAVLRPAPVADQRAETSVRHELLHSILRCTHGDLGLFAALHRNAIERDPLFYAHMASWYMVHGSVRDHQELFVATLLTSPLPEHRQHGRVLLQRLRPYQVSRVVRFSKQALHCTPRILRDAVEFYLRRREQDEAWFDECVMRDRGSMRYLYATFHLRPAPRAEAILFTRAVPRESRLYAARLLHRVRDNPSYQAELILQHHIHFTTAIGAIRHFTPAVMYALACVMTGPQLVTSLNFLQQRGALDHPETRAVIEARLRDAVSDGRLSEFKARVALGQVPVDGGLASELLRMTQAKIRSRGRLTVPTAILVDKSGSMQQCLEIGKLLGCMASTLADADLHVLAFDSHAFPVRASDTSFAAWEDAFRLLRADGATSIGAGLRGLGPHRVEQIVVISDGEENTHPMFASELAAYEQRHGFHCRIVFVKVGGARQTSFEQSMQGREMDVIPFDGDYYSLPNVVPLLCSPGFELIEEVLQAPLYTRGDLASLPPGFNPETFEVL